MAMAQLHSLKPQDARQAQERGSKLGSTPTHDIMFGPSFLFLLSWTLLANQWQVWYAPSVLAVRVDIVEFQVNNLNLLRPIE